MTVVLAAAAAGSVGTLQAGPVGVGCVLVAAVEAETAAPAAAARGAAEAPVWTLGSWADPAIQGEPGSLAAVAGPDREDPAAGHRETGQTEGLRLENKVAGTVGALGTGLAVAPGAEGACGAADRAVPLGCEEQKSAQGAVALGKVFGRLVVLVAAGSRGSAAGWGEEAGLAGRNTAPGPERHNLLVPAVHTIPSKQSSQTHKSIENNH